MCLRQPTYGPFSDVNDSTAERTLWGQLERWEISASLQWHLWDASEDLWADMPAFILLYLCTNCERLYHLGSSWHLFYGLRYRARDLVLPSKLLPQRWPDLRQCCAVQSFDKPFGRWQPLQLDLIRQVEQGGSMLESCARVTTLTYLGCSTSPVICHKKRQEAISGLATFWGVIEVCRCKVRSSWTAGPVTLCVLHCSTTNLFVKLFELLLH